MTKDISIRIATEKDISILAAFNQALALETEDKQLDTDAIAKGVQAVFLDENKGFYVVAEDSDDEIIGGLMITNEWSDWRNGWFWWIMSVYVRSEVRGKGVYKKLYEFVKERAKTKGNVCGFRLYVDIENIEAQKVYEKVGMEASNYLLFGEDV